MRGTDTSLPYILLIRRSQGRIASNAAIVVSAISGARKPGMNVTGASTIGGVFPIAPFSSPSSIFGSFSTDPTRRVFPTKEDSFLLFVFSQMFCKVVYGPLRPRHAFHHLHDFKCPGDTG